MCWRSYKCQSPGRQPWWLLSGKETGLLSWPKVMWLYKKRKKKKKLTSEHLHDWVFPNISCGVFCQFIFICLTSVQCSRSVMSNSLQPHGLQHARLPCPSSTPRAYSNSCPLSRWSHPTISSSVVPFSSRLQSFPASGSFPMSQFFALGGQSTRDSASALVLPINIQDWFP